MYQSYFFDNNINERNDYMLPKKAYYLNDYFDMFNMSYIKEYMKTDIYEKDTKYILEVDLPGIKKENITINYENGYLTIIARKTTLSSTPDKYIRRERFYGEIKRSFYIGIKKETDLKATYTNGILTIIFPKADIPKKEQKNITIN